MTIPTKSMKAGEEAWAVAAMVPVNAPGVKIVNTLVLAGIEPRASEKP
jgi:4-hydroxybutyryl-CoA dehydratase/vinylacetyl-CoA-Delta-isomerase